MDTMIDNGNNASVTQPEATNPPGGSPTPSTTTASGKARVAIGFLQRDKDAELVVDSETILAAMTGNAAFPKPSPTLSEIVAARNAYVASVSAAKDSSLAVSVRRQQRANLVALLGKLAHYVQVTGAGDGPTLKSSGFPLQRTRQPVGPLPAPSNLRLVRGKVSGTLVARCDRQNRAGCYQWRCAPTATPTAWLPIATTLSASATFDGLVPAMQYTVQVCVIGTAGPSNWSDVAMVVVL
ncbi:MAG TPA: hypothetical protein VK753_11445 [Xanthomonadaceae bacterium]|jgi:hypothetical protein|nr:hypothetical protein [Xanthomonadaceae bacterium]